MKHTRGNPERFAFDSWEDFIGNLPTLPSRRRTILGRASHDTTALQTLFTETTSFDAAMKLATDGWFKGNEKVTPLTNALIDKVRGQIRTTEVYWTHDGIDFDMGRVMTGEPECWFRVRESECDVRVTGKSIVHIVYNGGASGAVGNETIMQRGAAILALIDLFEAAGRSVELDVVFGVSNRRDYMYSTIRVKQADEIVNRDVLAFALLHPSMLRRFSFVLIEAAHSELCNDVVYGFPESIPEGERGDIYIDKALYDGEVDWNNSETVQEWLVNTLKSQGVEFTEE